MDITELESSGKEDYFVIKSDKKGEDKDKEKRRKSAELWQEKEPSTFDEAFFKENPEKEKCQLKKEYKSWRNVGCGLWMIKVCSKSFRARLESLEYYA